MLKKTLIGILFVCLFMPCVFGAEVDVTKDDFSIPRDKRNKVPATVDFVGCDYTFTKCAQGAAAVVISTYPVILYGVILGVPPAGLATGYVVLFDSSATQGASTYVGTDTTYKITPSLYHSTTSVNSGTTATPNPLITEYRFDPPFKLTRGLVAHTYMVDWEYTVLWRYRKRGNR